MLQIDFAGRGRDDVFAAYQDLGVLCFAGAPERVLLKAGGQEAESHYALRDVLLTIARIGGSAPLHMKIALLTSDRATAHVGAAMQPELVRIGCYLRVFAVERQALRWLGRGALRVTAPPGRASPGRPMPAALSR